MRNILSGCLVFTGLIMSTAPVLAETLVTPNLIFTCPNSCVVVMVDVNGNPIRVRDSGGGQVTVQQVRQSTNEEQ